MSHNPLAQLGRRERQIMDVVIRLGQASVSEVLAELPDPPSYSAVRGMLRLLTDKGHLRYEQDGPRYLYLPALDVEAVRRTALSDVVNTFFEGSMEATVSALLGDAERPLSEEELDRLASLIEDARNRETEQ
jgi:BlaI family transcriptional regulator, penicillinase repressor